MSNSQLSGAKDGSRHGALQPTSEPKDLLINTAAFLEKKNYKMRTKEKRVSYEMSNVTHGHEISSGKNNLSTCCCLVGTTFPNSLPCEHWTSPSMWHLWLLANHFDGIQTKISSVIIIMALNMNYRRAISTGAMVSNYKRFVLELGDSSKPSLLIRIFGLNKVAVI